MTTYPWEAVASWFEYESVDDSMDVSMDAGSSSDVATWQAARWSGRRIRRRGVTLEHSSIA